MQRVTFLSLVLLRVDVELPALHYRRALDSLPRGAINATEDHVDLILLDELPGFGFRNTIRRCTVLEVQIYLPPQQATLRIDVIDHHLGHVRIGDTQEREWTRLVRDYSHLDGSDDSVMAFLSQTWLLVMRGGRCTGRLAAGPAGLEPAVRTGSAQPEHVELVAPSAVLAPLDQLVEGETKAPRVRRAVAAHGSRRASRRPRRPSTHHTRLPRSCPGRFSSTRRSPPAP